MKERSISVTEASRNFAECVNRVRYQGLSFLLVKNGTPVARLVPAKAVKASAESAATTATDLPIESGKEDAAELVPAPAVRPQSLQW